MSKDMIITGRIMQPPIVGVPALVTWLGGPSSLIYCLTCKICSLFIAHLPKTKKMIREDRLARIILNVIYLKTFSQE
jgi:hypothetical protein